MIKKLLKNGQMYVRIGGNDLDWQPYVSSYQNYRENAHGSGLKVWVSIPENPEVQHAPLKSAFPVPKYLHADRINVPDEWLY